MTTTTFATRYEPTSWRLDELLGDSAAGATRLPPSGELAPKGATEARVAELLAGLEAEVARLEASRELLHAGMPASTLLDLLRQYERGIASASVVMGYASLRFAADTQDGTALALRTRVEQAITELQNRTLFLTLFWQELPDDAAASLLAQIAGAGASADLVFFLEDLRRLRRYKLDERSEQIVNWKDQDGIGAVLTLYSLITNAFEFTPEIDAERGKKLTRDQLMRYAYSAEPPLREAAYRELFRVYQANARPLQQMYVHRVQDWHNEHVRLRGYPSPIAVRNVANDVPDQAIDAMLEAVESGAGVFHRYFRFKAKRLGIERLRRFDIYAPLPGGAGASDPEVAFPDAAELVLETFDRFHPRFGSAARRVFDDVTSTPRRVPAKRAARSAPPSCPSWRPGCCSTTPAACATSPRWRTSSVTPCTRCSRRTTRCSPSTPACRWPRPPRCSASCS